MTSAGDATRRLFAPRLVAWHARHGRHDLPWQATRDPYRVWLSEIMLQQTQVATVQAYYLRFLERFPRIEDLAAAPLEEVMPLWAGLGYYARARNLHAAARRVVAEFGGSFPEAPDVIASLPGIGRSTANAIAAFCFGRRVPILDGNVKRVLCRVLAVEGHPGKSAVEQRLWREAEALLPGDDIASYIQAQMDLGATVCTRSSPVCGGCPVADLCRAHAEGRVAELPAPRPKRRVPERSATLLVLRHGPKVLLEQRPPQGIWGGLLGLPELSGGDPGMIGATLLHLNLGQASSPEKLESFQHVFSHFKLNITPLLIDVKPVPGAAEPGRLWLALDEADGAALPTPVRRILAACPPG